MPQYVEQLQQMAASAKFSKRALAQLTSNISESNQLVDSSLRKVSRTIELFKQLNIENYQENADVIDFNQLTDALRLDCKFSYPNRQIHWQFDQQISTPIIGYPRVISQIMSILVDNTLNHGYTPSQSANIALSFYLKKQRVYIRYQDFGCGINESERQNLFMPFNQEISGQHGLGLGMNMVYNLVTHKLLGRIQAQKNVDVGVCFVISFKPVCA